MRLTLLCTVCVAAGVSVVLFGRRSWHGFLWWLFGNGE